MIRNILKVLFFPLFGRIRSKPAAPATSVEPSNRVHLFAGSFASELDATDHCLTPAGRTGPTALQRDLPDATLDTGEVEMIFGAPRLSVALPMLDPQPDMGRANTLILIAEAAFGGAPYRLHDTPTLRYLGAATVS